MIRREKKLAGGRSGRENGSKWISAEEEEGFLQCSLERKKESQLGSKQQGAERVSRLPEEGAGAAVSAKLGTLSKLCCGSGTELLQVALRQSDPRYAAGGWKPGSKRAFFHVLH